MNEVLKLRLRQGAKVEDPAFDVTQDHYAVTYQGEDPVDNLRQALDWMIANPLDDVKKKFPGGNGPSNKLVVVSAQIYWQTPKLVLPSADALEGSDPFVNTGYHWLTYETVLNKPKFRKSNQEVKVGLYAACLSDMQLWFRDDIDDLPFKARRRSPPSLPSELVVEAAKRPRHPRRQEGPLFRSTSRPKTAGR